MEHERGPLRRRQPVEHDRKGALDLVVERDPVGRIRRRRAEERLGSLRGVRTGRGLPPAVRGPEPVQAHPAHDDGEPTAHVLELVEVDAASRPNASWMTSSASAGSRSIRVASPSRYP